MAQLNDVKFDALRLLGYIGAIDDMEKEWSTDNNLESTTGSPWYQFLIDAAVSPACINDMEMEFWEAGALFLPDTH